MSAMAKAQKGKGDGYMLEAKKTLNKKAWFASAKEKNQEDAAELFVQAATAYKVGGLHQEAGDAYTEAAKIYRDTLGNMNDASKCLSQAGTSYKKSSPVDAVDAYGAAIALMVDSGKLMSAAKLAKDLGDLYETEDVGTEEKSSTVLAIESYEQAAELFDMENAKSQASACLVKVAELCSVSLDPPDLIRAARIYDDLGKNCLDSNLLKYNAKGYFLQCIFCHLANGDAIAAQQALQRYGSLDYTFGESREGKFCDRLIECVEGYDAEGFATVCFEYDRISKLDPWKTTMLVRVKRTISDEDGGEDEDEVDLT